MFELTTCPAIALCSEALNEGLNLQGAAALVHLDLPTTLRVAEQRVGRVDRMDSPHDRIAPVAADSPWAFLALSGTRHGAPRWLILEGEPPQATVGAEAVAERLRVNLSDNPPNIPFDDNCERWLDRYLAVVARAETKLLPRRMQRALDQMAHMTTAWAEQALRDGYYDIAEQWYRLRKIARPGPDDDGDQLDPYLVGEVWWDRVRPLFADLPSARRHRRYTRLRDLDQLLRAHPLDLSSLHDRTRANTGHRPGGQARERDHPGRSPISELRRATPTNFEVTVAELAVQAAPGRP